MNFDLNELDFQNIAIWPRPFRILFVAFVCLVVLFLGYWFDTKVQMQNLSNMESKATKLKTTFETKYHQANNLSAYKQQMEDMKASFGVLLRQLPETTEVPGLLEDISRQGVASGLEFRSIRLLPEKALDFYVELPIEIAVEGSYHQFAEFVSHVAALPRIVTLHDFMIQLAGKDGQGDDLVMSITAKTYRYTAEEEL